MILVIPFGGQLSTSRERNDYIGLASGDNTPALGPLVAS